MAKTIDDIKAKLERLDREAREKKAKIEAEAKSRSEKLKNQLKRAEQHEKAKSRKDETRRKILAGSLVLDRMEKDEAFATKFRGDLDRFLTRDIDRALFDLKPAQHSPTSPKD